MVKSLQNICNSLFASAQMKTSRDDAQVCLSSIINTWTATGETVFTTRARVWWKAGLVKADFNEYGAAQRIKSFKLIAWNYISFFLLLEYQQIKAIIRRHNLDRRSASSFRPASTNCTKHTLVRTYIRQRDCEKQPEHRHCRGL